MLFPRPIGQRVLIKSVASVEDTLNLMREKLPETLDDTKKIAAKLRGKSVYESCKNTWNFVYRHIPYNPDLAGIEQVRRPATTWHFRNVSDEEGKKGVDCDCYSEFIGSILMNLKIPFKFRIAMYPRKDGESPYWQHVYVIVPKDGNTKRPLSKRNEYIVLDCVKDGFDEEHPYLKIKDYDMRLEYLNGLDEGIEERYTPPCGIDARDMAEDEDNAEELGKLAQWLKKAGDEAGKGIRAVNRYADPLTQSTRSGLLLAAKVNMMNLGGKLKYAYLTDDQAKAKDIKPEKLAHLRKIRDSIENIYWQMGGKKENFRKAVLGGKGNKNREVPMAGLGDTEEYADEDERRIVNSVDGLAGLGIGPDTGASLAAITAMITKFTASIKKVGSIFNSATGKEAGDFLKDNTGNSSSTSELTSLLKNPGSNAQTTDNNTATTTNQNTTSVARSGQSTDSPDAGASDTGSGQQDSKTKGDDQKQDQKGVIAWVKENPVTTTLIGTGIVSAISGTLMYLHARKDAQKWPVKVKGLNGLAKSKAVGRKKKKSKTRKQERHSTTILI